MSINLKFPLQRGSRGAFETNEDTLSAIADDLRMLIITNYGERPIHYDFGANLRGLIFEFQGEQLNQAVKDHIQAAIDKWMPFVNVVSINVDTEETSKNVRPNEILVTIEFSVGNLDVTKTLTQTVRA